MWFGFVTLFPEMIETIADLGVFGRARREGLLQVTCINPRDFTHDKHRTVDDRPYGGGAGMVMRYEPLMAAVNTAKEQAPQGTPVVLMSPQGQVFRQAAVTQNLELPGLILVCGRYEGLDERFIEDAIDWEWSVGDYVLSGGELPALVVADAFARHVPGVLGNSLSNIDESHLDDRLDYPHYTRPEIVGSKSVPKELLSGHHEQIEQYRHSSAFARTYQRRPEMLVRRLYNPQQLAALSEALFEAPE